MKAIITKIIPATNTKPVRVKIQAEGVPHITVGRDAIESILINLDERVTEETIHQAAAKVLCGRYRWDGELASGGTPTCGVWCHCFIPKAVAGPVSVNDELAGALGALLADAEQLKSPYRASEELLTDCHKALDRAKPFLHGPPATPVKPEPWKVIAISANHGSFGHKGVVVARSNGEALELTLQAYGSTPLPNVGDLLDTLPTSEVQPRKFANPPQAVIDNEFTPATASDFLAICGKFNVEVSVARECEAIRALVDGGQASFNDIHRAFRREF